MAQIYLNIGNGLQFNANKQVSVKLNPNSHNHLTIESDGLCLTGITSESISQQVLKKNQSHYSVLTDHSPWGSISTNNADYEGYVTCDCKTHRIWTAQGFDPNTTRPIGLTGKNTNDPIRSGLDWVLPGDFFRIPKDNNKFDYYIITSVTPNESNGKYHPGNEVLTYALLLENGDDF